MSEYQIPAASLDRLRSAYAQFEQLAVVISEAMGLDPTVSARIDLPRGVFVVEDGAAPMLEAEQLNGVAA